ncbi:MAG: hypothetical protein CMO81_05440 [Waddliaceae bacterium]|nr:hypothetical protein [Waddliaceae bacterium]
MSQPEISLCMIVKNEERNLPDFIKRHKSFFDEWIIVDTGSKDNTKNILQEAGIKPHSLDWFDNFAAARNHALSLCTGKWVLSLDADEWIDTENQEQILYYLKENVADCFDIPIKNYIKESTILEHNADYLLEYTAPDNSYRSLMNSEKDYGYRQTSLVRLFKNHRGYRWVSPIHEVISDEGSPYRNRMGKIEGVCIHHFGMLDLEGKAEKKRQLYGDIARSLQEKINSTNDPKTLFEAARFIENPEERLKVLEKAIEKAPKDPHIHKLLINTHIERKDIQGAIQTCESMIEQDPKNLEFHLALAQCHVNEKDTHHAAKTLKSRMPLFKKEPLYHYTLATIYIRNKQFPEAQSHAKRAHQLAPNSPMIKELYKKLQKPKEN